MLWFLCLLLLEYNVILCQMYKCESMKYVVLVRFSSSSFKDDFEKRFDNLVSALDYFKFLVSLDFDSLLDSFWYVSLSSGKRVIRSYYKYIPN